MRHARRTSSQLSAALTSQRRARSLDARGVRLQQLRRRAGALGAAQDRSGADGGGADDAAALRARSAIAVRRWFPALPTDCSTRSGFRRIDATLSRSATIDWFAALVDSGFRVAQPVGVVPAPRNARRRRRLMLIDSHCHLEYKGLVEDQPAVLARARAAGIAGILNISTRRREWARGHRHRRRASPTSGPASASIRTRPTRMPTSGTRR